MSSYAKGYVEAGPATVGIRLVPGALQADYPALAAALAGIEKPEGGGLLVPPIKILIWAECGRIEASLLTWKGGMKAFVPLPEGTAWEQALNDLLESGRIPWKK